MLPSRKAALRKKFWDGLGQKRQRVTNVDEDVEKSEPSYAAGGNKKWSDGFSKRCIDLLSEPAILFLGIHARIMNMYFYTAPQTFIEILCIVEKNEVNSNVNHKWMNGLMKRGVFIQRNIIHR